ncbi:YadA-like family protein [Escherichia coli]|uniref:YadA C-terminal domain-containing protein n=1 Tax=Escherichia coli TaxID=562 RepID=UPI000DD4D840|nr:YadA C-terminal domain-containing protein [Escherichia coli]EKB6107400.1 YadA-like family protein [Escherichia coli]EKC0274500.1 YadA-like family protein [Escherichia coli]EKG5905563.1 YadA-like family protein [Escherichia coli]EKH1569918.1 YadA-like family protein [Escherichia coli]EKH7588943.1 YadA-like family protein [Escherichia coli]
MSKKFTKTILSAIMTGIFIGASASASAVAQEFKYGVYSKNHDHDQKFISSDKFVFVYDDESKKAEIRFGSNPYNNNYANKTIIKNIQQDGTFDVVTADGSLTYRVYDKDVAALMRGVVAGGITPDKKLNLYETDVYNLVNKVWAMEKAEANVGLDKYGNVAADPSEIEEHMSLQRYLAGEAANSTIVANELDAQKGELEAQKQNLGKLTTRTDKIDAAAAATAAKVESRTLVGVSSDGTLTRAEGAKNTISVNDGLVALSGRTDRIDAAVGAIDGRVTRNTQSIEKNSKAIAANTRTLQQHSARLDSQQRQINENHKEMKRAAAQSAALTGLFQPYSVGKFNATAAVGGYSDQQALAVGVGYRFNEQTAAKAGVAFSDGDASWNVGVNFEF